MGKVLLRLRGRSFQESCWRSHPSVNKLVLGRDGPRSLPLSRGWPASQPASQGLPRCLSPPHPCQRDSTGAQRASGLLIWGQIREVYLQLYSAQFPLSHWLKHSFAEFCKCGWKVPTRLLGFCWSLDLCHQPSTHTGGFPSPQRQWWQGGLGLSTPYDSVVVSAARKARVL